MAIDTSIYSQIKPLQIDNPLTQYAQIAALQQAQSQNRLADLVYGEKQREIGDQQAVRDALAGAGGDYKAASSALLNKGFYKQAIEIDKAEGDRQKAAAEMEAKRVEAARKKLEIAGQAFGFVRNNPTLEAAMSTLDYLQANGIYSPDQVTQYKATITANPAQIKSLADQAFMSVLQADKQLPTMQTRDTGATTDTIAVNPVTQQASVVSSVKNTQSPDNAASVAATLRGQNLSRDTAIRGQNLTDARAREANAAGKLPAGYRWSADGTKLEAIPGGPADKAATATEGERKAATLLQRLEFSEQQLKKAVSEKPSAAKPGIASSGLRTVGMEALANAADSPERQRVIGAQLDILDAALTLGTGAAYTREQLEGYRQSYFPQLNDDEKTIKDKQDRLNNVIRAAKIAAGRAASSKPTEAPAGPPKAGDVMDGYRFKGGNPADKSNWVKVN